MRVGEAYQWLKRGERRQEILLLLTQPMTARQLSRLTERSLDCCSRVLKELATYCLVTCVNPRAGRGRLYWVTALGRVCEKRLRKDKGLPVLSRDLPGVDWELYGWVCYSHRAAVIRALEDPLQPADIKRKARVQNPELKMSANNVRDVIRLFLKRGVVEAVWGRKGVHPMYQLTEVGEMMQTLLFSAGNRGSEREC